VVLEDASDRGGPTALRGSREEGIEGDGAREPADLRLVEGVLEPIEADDHGEVEERRRTPIRGGTDGSRLSEMGLPTPNIFTDGQEYRSRREWASVQDMAAAAATIVRLAAVWADR